MQMCLDRLFIETEHEREEQERLEKQQAERIAAGGFGGGASWRGAGGVFHVFSCTPPGASRCSEAPTKWCTSQSRWCPQL